MSEYHKLLDPNHCDKCWSLSIENFTIKQIKIIAKTIPLLQYIIDTNDGYIFGGLIRWIISQYFLSNCDKKKNGDDEGNTLNIYDYLIDNKGDIDIKVRYDPYIDCRFDPESIFKKVIELNGYIEYMGYTYNTGEDEKKDEENNIVAYIQYDAKNNNDFKVMHKLKYGSYSIWIPYGNKGEGYIKFDLLLMKAAACDYLNDYLCNHWKLIFNKGNYTFNRDSNKKLKFISIKNKLLFPIFNDDTLSGLKILFRMKNLWKKGYKPTTYCEIFLKFIYVIKNSCQKGIPLHGYKVFITDTSIPSIPVFLQLQPISDDKNSVYLSIKPTRHQCIPVNINMFDNDEELNKIIEELKSGDDYTDFLNTIAYEASRSFGFKDLIKRMMQYVILRQFMENRYNYIK